MYAHLKEISVSPGQKISARQKIGSIGRGYNNEWIAHLHLELREGFTTTAGPGYTSSKVSKGPQSQISAENYIANNKCR